MTGRRGITLLEMLVASAIMAIAVVGLLSGLSGAVRNAARLSDYDRAAQLAQLRINELLLDPNLRRNVEFEGPFDRSLSGGMESGWRARVTEFERGPSPGAGDFALDRIQLEIWWMSGGRRRTFTLDAYRPRVLKQEDVGKGTQ